MRGDDMNLVSLFTGAGGLDLGFEKAGFKTVWANEYDSTIWETFEINFPKVHLEKRSIVDIKSSEVPEAVGFIGGPPCQSWSEAGAGRGINDHRGQVFYDYIRLLKDKRPKFFLAENVSGILLPRHAEAFLSILKEFENSGYSISYELLNANDYNVPQDRKRVIIVGFCKDLNFKFQFPKRQDYKPVLKDAIYGMPKPKAAKEFNKANHVESLAMTNHEYMNGNFSTIYMSRNRVRSWNEPSFTIQAGGRHAPIHPQAPKMKFIEQNKRIFVPGKEDLYRRLSVRECARIQTFPDEFVFKYQNIADGYKMVGNAVPVEFAKCIAKKIMIDLKSVGDGSKKKEANQKSSNRELCTANI